MTHFSPDVEIRRKDDHSPVTDADIEANTLITNALHLLAPHIPIIAEESTTNHHLPTANRFWLVDPLDGTRAFVKGEAEFTVNIGLIENGAPVLGVIYAPPQETLYYGQVGAGAFRVIKNGAPEKLRVRKPAADGMVVVRSKSHPSPATQAYLDTLKVKHIIPGSSSVKFCNVAEGSADIYPRFGRTMEWDTAAGHAILLAAGGRVETPDGKPLTYGKPGFENPHFIAFGG